MVFYLKEYDNAIVTNVLALKPMHTSVEQSREIRNKSVYTLVSKDVRKG